jgi:hypothetical protein
MTADVDASFDSGGCRRIADFASIFLLSTVVIGQRRRTLGECDIVSGHQQTRKRRMDTAKDFHTN